MKAMKAMMAMMTMMVMMQTKCTSYSARCSMKAMVVMMAIFWVNVSKALFTNDVYKPYHHPMLQIMTFVDGTVQGVLQRMIVDETL